MSGCCRLLWSVIVLLSAGCQSLPSGSTALFPLTGGDRAAEDEPIVNTSASPRSLWGLGRQGILSSTPSQTTVPDTMGCDALPGAWGEDEVLQMVIQQEFEGASDEERGQWMQRLAVADPEEIPRLLAQRRQRLEAGESSTSKWSTDPRAVEAKAQQIILTEQEPTADLVPTATGLVPPSSESETPHIVIEPRSESPSQSGAADSALTAPEPVRTGHLDWESGVDEKTRTDPADDMSQESSGFMANVFDVFGVGGVRASAGQEAISIRGIQPAGLSDNGIGSKGEVDKPAQSKPLDLQSTKSLQSVYWQEDLDKLIALLEAQTAQQTPGESAEEQERYVRQHVALRMLYLIASRRPEALQAIPDVPRDVQEFWTQMFWALASTFDDEAIPNSTVRAAETVAQLRAAVRQRASRAALQLQHSQFCQRIDGFGDYVPFPQDRFEAGQPVLIYTEVNNLLSKPTGDGDFRTVLQSKVTIRQGGESGRTMFQQDLPQTEDRCRSRRDDYFHSYRIQLPDTLQSGPHVLILEVTDTLGGRSGRATMNFLVP